MIAARVFSDREVALAFKQFAEALHSNDPAIRETCTRLLQLTAAGKAVPVGIGADGNFLWSHPKYGPWSGETPS